MSLDVAKLEKVRELAGGIVQARCPACAEGGGDRKGEHLRIYPDGRYGCCVHPKDGEHRKRIFALAGVRKAGTFTLRLKTPPAMTAALSVRAALECRMQSEECRMGERGKREARTLRTPVSESEKGVPGVPTPPADDFRTGRTGIFKSRAYAREDSPNVHTPVYMCKDLESGVLPVLSVPEGVEGEAGLPPTAAGEHLPYLTPGGTLVIPFDSPERYHWWKPPHDQRQRVATTWNEVKERMKHGAALGGGNPKSEDRRPKAESEEEYYGDGV